MLQNHSFLGLATPKTVSQKIYITDYHKLNFYRKKKCQSQEKNGLAPLLYGCHRLRLRNDGKREMTAFNMGISSVALRFATGATAYTVLGLNIKKGVPTYRNTLKKLQHVIQF
jgi:hypothetical protein